MHTLFSLGAGLFILLAATPSSSNYTLKNYDIGGSGGSSSSTNYKLNGTGGSQSGSVQSSSTYQTDSGNGNTTNSNVPPAPTFTNPSNYYDRLQLTINTGGNPSDTKYLIAISSDNFVTTNYVQSDNSVASSQALTNYQTYTSWGGASGFYVLGLSQATPYKVKVKALQGNFTGSAFGPTASASTVSPSISMSLGTTTSSTPPYAINFPSLVPATIVTANDDILVGLSTNALSGGNIYVVSLNGGLKSIVAARTITSATTDLGSIGTGFGAQVVAASQASGGPFTAQSPYNGSADNVGGLLTSLQPIVASSGQITSASATIRLKARVTPVFQSAPDYTDTLTLVAAMTF